jgi:hypothetical protein
MQDSHTPVPADETAADLGSLRLVSAAAVGLPERLAGRLDEHLSRFVEHMTQGLLAASTAVGLDVVVELMELEVAELAGPKGRHNPARAAKRHGNDQGTVTLGGRRLPIRRPRVRSTGDQERELPLESYATFASTDLLAEQVVARMLAGLSTRRYPAGLEPVGWGVEQAATGTSKSAVSRRFVAATAERLAALLARRLDDRRWLVVFLDGFGMGEHLLVGALGVTDDGTKVPWAWSRAPPRTRRSASGWSPTWPSEAWTPAMGCCLWSTAARRWIGPSGRCSVARRSSKGVVGTRSATFWSICPRWNVPSSSGGCVPPGRSVTPTRPRPNWRPWPAG